MNANKSKKISVGSHEGYYYENLIIQGGGSGYTKRICIEKGEVTYQFMTQYLADSPAENKKAVIELFEKTLSTFKFQ